MYKSLNLIRIELKNLKYEDVYKSSSVNDFKLKSVKIEWINTFTSIYIYTDKINIYLKKSIEISMDKKSEQYYNVKYKWVYSSE